MAKKNSRNKKYIQLSKDSKGNAVLKTVSLRMLLLVAITSFISSFAFSLVKFTGYAVSDISFSVFSITGVFLFLLGIALLAIYIKLK